MIAGAQQDVNRLVSSDRVEILRYMCNVMTDDPTISHDDLVAAGIRATSCTRADLRDSEITLIDALARRVEDNMG